MKRTNFGPKLGAWLLVVGLGASGILLATPTTVHAAQSAHTVPLDCSADGGDQRTAAEASVQPSVIVATPESFGPTTYQAYGIDDSGHLQPIGNVNEEVTTDHLVAGWQNSTNCLGATSLATLGLRMRRAMFSARATSLDPLPTTSATRLDYH